MPDKPNLDHISTDLRPLAVPIADLHPDPANLRKHNPKNMATIRASLAAFGQRKNIVVNRHGGVTEAGAGALLAAREMGWTHMAVSFEDDDAVTAMRFGIVDNRSSDLSEFDDGLGDALKTLADEDVDLDALGFDDEDLEDLWDDGGGGGPDPPEPKDPPAAPVSEPGVVYELGPHRLICGDSTDPETWDLLMTEPAQAVWTDPPYGVNLNKVQSVDEAKARRRRTDGQVILNDDMTEEQLRGLLTDSLGLAHKHCEQGGAWYIASPSGDRRQVFGEVLKGLKVWRHSLVWVKDVFAFGRMDYHYQHETIFYGWKEGSAHNWFSDRKQTSVLEFDRPKVSKEHPSMKPVPLIEYCLQNSTRPQWRVVDCFGGSGQTLLACARTGRVCRMIELSPGYVDVIRDRWTTWAREAGQDPGPGALQLPKAEPKPKP